MKRRVLSEFLGGWSSDLRRQHEHLSYGIEMKVAAIAGAVITNDEARNMMYLELIILVNGRFMQWSVTQERIDVVASVETLHLLGRAAWPRATGCNRFHVADLNICK